MLSNTRDRVYNDETTPDAINADAVSDPSCVVPGKASPMIPNSSLEELIAKSIEHATGLLKEVRDVLQDVSDDAPRVQNWDMPLDIRNPDDAFHYQLRLAHDHALQCEAALRAAMFNRNSWLRLRDRKAQVQP
jgi:hypothetical protein